MGCGVIIVTGNVMGLRYSWDGVEVYEGDARGMGYVGDGSVGMVVTSPPYWNARSYSSWLCYEDYLADMAMVWAECYRVLCDGGRIAVVVPLTYGRPDNGGCVPIGMDVLAGIQEAGFTLRGIVIWDKGNMLSTAWGSWCSASNPSLRDNHEVIIVAHKGSSSRAGEGDVDKETFLKATASVWRVSPVQGWHPAPFPVEIPRQLIELYTFVGDVVLDPFMGSGTAVWEARRLGRRAIGVERNREYIERACGPLLLGV